MAVEIGAVGLRLGNGEKVTEHYSPYMLRAVSMEEAESCCGGLRLPGVSSRVLCKSRVMTMVLRP